MKQFLPTRAIAATVALVLAISVGGYSFATGKDEKPAPAPDAQAMEMMMQYAQPGEHHKMLEAIAGTWNVKVISTMPPGPPTESAGTSTNRWVLGGRWLEQEFAGDFMGMPFNGIGFTGYDNVKKKYIALWMDNMNTAVMIMEGEVDASGKVITSWSEMDDPMSGQKQAMRTVTTIVDNNHHNFEMFVKGPDGSEMKMMEINYTRKM